MQNKQSPATCVRLTIVACSVRLVSVWIGWTSSLPGCAERLAGACANADIMLAVKVPVRIFVTKQLPKTATGKIQRRMMVEHFIKGPGQEEEAGKGGQGSGKTPAQAHCSKL